MITGRRRIMLPLLRLAAIRISFRWRGWGNIEIGRAIASSFLLFTTNKENTQYSEYQNSTDSDSDDSPSRNSG